MTFFMEVEPPVATLPLRVPAACPAAEEAVMEAEAAVLDAEEAEPPQAVRVAAAAAAPQTVRKERREIFFMIEFPPFKPGLPPGTVFLCFPWERPYSTALPPLPRPWTCKKCVKLCAYCQPQCKEQVTRHKTKSRRALLFPRVPGGGCIRFYSTRPVTFLPLFP